MVLTLFSVAIVLCGIGCLVTALDFYLSFLRYPLHRLSGGTRENYRWVSGLPLFGSMFLWLGAAFLTEQPPLLWSALIVSLLDTGGLHWFIATMVWYHVMRKPLS